MNVLEIYNGSDGEKTKALYAKLETLGPVGLVCVNLFRAMKASARAKDYSRRYKGVTYEKKQWSMANLCDVLAIHGAALGIVFGWRIDPQQQFYPWVLYVELPFGMGQCSFHNGQRLKGPDYAGEWDGTTGSASRIIRYVQGVYDLHFPRPADCDSASVLRLTTEADSLELSVGNSPGGESLQRK